MRHTIATMLILLVFMSAVSPAVHAQSDPDLVRELVAALNAWRVDEGLWPLQRNATLDALAQEHADYLISLPAVPDEDIHSGPNGESPPERARAAPYHWPDYGRRDRVAIGEIAYVGASADRAITWWQGSGLHSRTVTNNGYREIGVGIAPHRYGNVMIVVFGARPNVLPAQVDSANGVLYLSDERYRWAGNSPDRVNRVTQFRLFDADGKPLTQDWQDWEPTLALPDDVGDQVFVMYTDGVQQALASVDLQADLAVLPDTLAAIIALEEAIEQQVAVQPTPTPTAQPTARPTATPLIAATAAATVRATAPPTSTPVAGSAADPTTAPTIVPTVASTPSASATPTAVPGSEPDVALLYDRQSLTVLNVSGQAVDLSSLALRSTAGDITIDRWQNQFLNVSLSAFPADNCLQTWAWTETTDPVKPSACRILRSVLTLSPQRVFWTEGEFDVFWDSTRLTTCSAAEGECLVELPAFVQ